MHPAGIEPARPKTPDLESDAYTNFATDAIRLETVCCKGSVTITTTLTEVNDRICTDIAPYKKQICWMFPWC